MGKTLLFYDNVTGDIKGFNSTIREDIPYPSIEITEDELYNFYMKPDVNGKYKLNPKTLRPELIPEHIVNPIDTIKSELQELDIVLPRPTEDLIAVMQVDISKLPQIMQDRLKRKIELRQQLKNLTN